MISCMIGQLTGTIAAREAGSIILDVAGVGYLLRVTSPTYQLLTKKEGAVTLRTHLAVRENALDLYGFLEEKELHFFELLLTVSGIGPKTALAVLSVADVETIISAVSEGNSAYLTKVAGIGRKIAEKIVLELRDKVGAIEKASVSMQEDSDVLEALRSLGYQASEAREALKQLPKEMAGASDRLKAALKMLGTK